MRMGAGSDSLSLLWHQQPLDVLYISQLSLDVWGQITYMFQNLGLSSCGLSKLD